MRCSIYSSLMIAFAFSACVHTSIPSLIGEDAEIARLLDTESVATPATSPKATAQRLYLALSQSDSEVAWALLSMGTKNALNQRAALIKTTGPELLQSSSLPQKDGQLVKVNYVSVFFGADLTSITLNKTDNSISPDHRELHAISMTNGKRQLNFLKEPDGWKLHNVSF
jgi:hypothetical protein